MHPNQKSGRLVLTFSSFLFLFWECHNYIYSNCMQIVFEERLFSVCLEKQNTILLSGCQLVFHAWQQQTFAAKCCENLDAGILKSPVFVQMELLWYSAETEVTQRLYPVTLVMHRGNPGLILTYSGKTSCVTQNSSRPNLVPVQRYCLCWIQVIHSKSSVVFKWLQFTIHSGDCGGNTFCQTRSVNCIFPLIGRRRQRLSFHEFHHRLSAHFFARHVSYFLFHWGQKHSAVWLANWMKLSQWREHFLAAMEYHDWGRPNSERKLGRLVGSEWGQGCNRLGGSATHVRTQPSITVTVPSR